MPNKLRDIFMDDLPTLKVSINFKDSSSHDNFIKTLEKVWDEGTLKQVEGVADIDIYAESDDKIYPIEIKRKFDEVSVGPCYEEILLDLDTEFGNKQMKLFRIPLRDEIVLRTDKESIIDLQLKYTKGSDIIKLIIRPHPEKAESVRDIAEYFSLIYSFLNFIFKNDDQDDMGIGTKENGTEFDLINIMTSLKRDIQWYEKIMWLEQEFDISFDPRNITEDKEMLTDLEELYLLLYRKETLRLNSKINVKDSEEIFSDKAIDDIQPGVIMDLSFPGTATYKLWGYTLEIYTANLLENVVVKDKINTDNGGTKILYTENAEQPMFLSYRGYRTEKEAKEELNNIMQHRETYQDAITLNEYIHQENESYKNCYN